MAARAPHGHNRRISTDSTPAMRPALLACALSLSAFQAAAAALPSAADLAAAAAEVRAAEIAFASTMADRRLDRFAEFVAEDAVFNGNKPHIGRAAVVQTWKGFFDGPQAPFSWAPDAVAASADGRFAVSTGLARDAAGKVISRFTTIWRKDGDGRWRVIVDQGVDEADCTAPQK
jgi:ketosteroid isomerase-like protein